MCAPAGGIHPRQRGRAANVRVAALTREKERLIPNPHPNLTLTLTLTLP